MDVYRATQPVSLQRNRAIPITITARVPRHARKLQGGLPGSPAYLDGVPGSATS